MSDFDTSGASDVLESSMSTGETSKEYFDHIKKINDLFYDQIKISDQKAAYIFTFMLAFLVSSSEGRGVFSSDHYNQGLSMALASALLAVGCVFSICTAILVVLPRRAKAVTSLFWGDWPRQRDVFSQAAHRADVEYLFDQYLRNADTLADIARRKYRFVTMAFRGLFVTVLAYVILLLVTG